MSSCQRINELVSGYLDGELTQGDMQRVDVHLKSCARCRQMLDDMTKLRGAVARSQSPMELEQQQWERIMNDLPARASSGVGWILLISGFVALTGISIWQFAIDNQVPWYIKLAIGAAGFGTLFLFLSVLRQRLISWKSDKYKDVQI